LDHAWAGLDARAHQLSTLALHFLASLFLFAVLRFMVTRSSRSTAEWAFFPPLGGALCWLLAPAHIDALAGITGRGAQLAGLAWLVAFWAFAARANCEQVRGKALALGAVVVAVTSHAAGLLAPVLLLTFDRIFLAPTWREVWARRGRWHAAYFAVAALALVAMRKSGSVQGGSWLERWAEGAGRGRYLGEFAWSLPLLGVVMVAVIGIARLGRLGGFGLIATAVGLGVWGHGRTAIHADAVTLWSEAARRRPSDSEVHLELGGTLAAAGRVDAALEQFERAVELAPRDATAHLRLAGMLAQAGRVGEAVAEYETCLKLAPDLAPAHLGLAGLQFRLGRAAPAASHYEAATRLGVSVAERRRQQGGVLAELGRLDEALEELDAAMKLAPDDGETRLLRGMVLSAAGRAEEGMKEFVAAVRLRPEDASAHAALGDALVDDRRPAEAMAHYETALRSQPARSGPLHASMGTALALLGRAPEAMAAYEEALRVNPDDAAARTGLERVRTAAERHSGKKR
jgi:tetratricopeptide (TPR) repeat protein